MGSPQNNRTRRQSGRRPLPRAATLLLLLLVALTAAAFWPVTGNDFIAYDDTEYLTNNEFVRSGVTGQGLRWAFTTTKMANWHPLTWLSHMLDVELFGMRPGWHHAVSLTFHVANTLLLWRLLSALTGALWRSALVAALFAVHPLHVESVSWASERKDLLCALFALMAALAYLRELRRTGTARRAIAAPLFLALSLLSKPMTVSLPFVLLLLDWWPLGRWSPAGGAPPGAARPLARLLPPIGLWLEKTALFALAGASSVITFLVQDRAGAITPAEVLPFTLRAANAATGFVRYLGKTFWPFPLQVHYAHEASLPAWWLIGGALLALASCTALFWGLRRRHPWWAVGWLWFLGMLVPVIGLVQVGTQALADRYTYLPLVGVFLALVWSLPSVMRLPPALGAAGLVAIAALLALLAVLSNHRASQWENSYTLFAPDAERGQDATEAHSILAIWHLDHGNLDQALAHGLKTLRQDPRSPELNNNVGAILFAQGRHEEALAHYRTALDGKPDFAQPLFNTALILAGRGELAEAITLFRRVVQLAPETPGARLLLGRALAEEAVRKAGAPTEQR